jgi:hypothetical protein
LLLVIVKDSCTLFLLFASLAHHGSQDLLSAIGTDEYREWYDLVFTVDFELTASEFLEKFEDGASAGCGLSCLLLLSLLRGGGSEGDVRIGLITPT